MDNEQKAKYPRKMYQYYGSGAKIIFPHFDTIILTFMYHFPGDEID